MQTACPTVQPPFGAAYIPLYHAGEVNHCPSCTRRQWIVGRMVAECAFCGTALPLGQFSTYSASPRSNAMVSAATICLKNCAPSVDGRREWVAASFP